MDEDFEIELFDDEADLTRDNSDLSILDSVNEEKKSTNFEEVENEKNDGNDVPEAKIVQLPMNYIQVGEIENDDVKVYIKQNVFERLENLAASDVEHELGSIILGEYSESMNKMNVIISDFIEAKYTDASASTLTFTHKTWDYIHKEHEENYPDKKILGWQHTHPGYGIFLSNYDMFIQENFFNLPFQVAYVIDPKQKIRGFFQWNDGKVRKLKGYYIYDEIGEKIDVDLDKAELALENSEKVNTSKLPSLITIALIIAVVFLAGMVFTLSSQIKKQAETQSQLESLVVQQSDEIYNMKASEDAIIYNPKSETTTISQEKTVKFIQYTVKSGDSIYSICQDKNIDFNKNLNIIKSVNGISNINNIATGQILLLPDYS